MVCDKETLHRCIVERKQKKQARSPNRNLSFRILAMRRDTYPASELSIKHQRSLHLQSSTAGPGVDSLNASQADGIARFDP